MRHAPSLLSLTLSACALLLSGSALAQTKWDLPTGYPATNFHTENIQQFADEVDKASGGKLKIQVHANASLFKAPEIKRAVQGGQAQAGEIQSMLGATFKELNAEFGFSLQAPAQQAGAAGGASGFFPVRRT